MRQRPPLSSGRRLEEMARVQRTGGARENVAAAAPVPEATRALALAMASLSANTALQPKTDPFTLTADGAQSVDLTYLPVAESEHVYLNGIELGETGPFWSRSGQTLSLTSSADARTGDKLVTKYLYAGGVPSTPMGPLPDYITSTYDNTQNVNISTPNVFALPTGITAGRMLVMVLYTGDRFHEPATPSGWTRQGHCRCWHANVYAYTRVADGTEGSTVSVDFTLSDSGSAVGYGCAVYEPSTVHAVAAKTSTGAATPDSDANLARVTVTVAPVRIVHIASAAASVSGTNIATLGPDPIVRFGARANNNQSFALGDYVLSTTGLSTAELATPNGDPSWADITIALAGA